MLKRLLVPLDGTPESVSALPVARAISVATGATIMLFRVVPGWEGDGVALDRARRALTGVAATLVGGSPEQCVVGVPRGDDAATAIARQAHDGAADLIVMATHARSGLERLDRESVAMRTVRLSPVPVVLVAPGEVGEPRLRTILVPVDGTPAGEVAIDSAVELAQASGAEIALLRIVVPSPEDEYEPLLGSYMREDERLAFDTSALEGARRYVATCADRLRTLGITAHGFAIFGGVDDAILEFAERVDADLIAMSTHARLGMARSVLGSAADAIVQRARRPVLLVRREAKGTSRALGWHHAAVGVTG